LLIDDINKFAFRMAEVPTRNINSMLGGWSATPQLRVWLTRMENAEVVCPHTPVQPFSVNCPHHAFQNNCGPTAKNPGGGRMISQKVKQATFTHDFFINHFQLGVNDKFHHEV
jgi:hypothetical protein